jgi:PAS domain S-box-containing protein
MANILIVDDERNIREVVARILEIEGYRVLQAESYEQAIEKLDTERVDLILTDILLGGRSGIDVLNEVNSRFAGCPVIVMTGAPSIETASDAVRLGADNYITKPFSDDTLLNAIRLSLKNRASEEEKEKYRANIEAVFRSVQDAIVTVDSEIKVLELNDTFLRMFGVSRDVIGKPLADMGMPVSAKCLDLLERTITEKAQLRKDRMECPGSEGGVSILSINSAPLLNSDMEQAGAVLVIRDETKLARLEDMLGEREHLHNMTGRSPQMQEVYGLIKTLADVETTVLVLGETGTGKELVAEALHNLGNRSSGPLIKVNCSALSENLLESELFGHVKGAFTGAVSDRTGRFEAAHGGTIFLDEIGDISPALQVKLLRVLQEKTIERVGDPRTRQVDVRVIAATNRDLPERIREGAFREDLYYRLKVVELHLPPLRERLEDIPLLADEFIREFNDRFGKSVEGLSDDALGILLNNQWPGNVRELKHFIERAVILCKGNVISLSDLPVESSTVKEDPYLSESGDEAERIRMALVETGWNKSRAAKQLGMSRQTLYTRIKELGLKQK